MHDGDQEIIEFDLRSACHVLKRKIVHSAKKLEMPGAIAIRLREGEIKVALQIGGAVEANKD